MTDEKRGPYSAFDHVMIRIKDTILIATSLGAIVVVCFGFLAIPGKVEAHDKRIKNHEERIDSNEDVLARLDEKMTAMMEKVNEIGTSQKEILKELRRA